MADASDIPAKNSVNRPGNVLPKMNFTGTIKDNGFPLIFVQICPIPNEKINKKPKPEINQISDFLCNKQSRGANA